MLAVAVRSAGGIVVFQHYLSWRNADPATLMSWPRLRLERTASALGPSGAGGRLISPAFTALVLTEVNPTHDPAGALLGRYLDGVIAALAKPARDH